MLANTYFPAYDPGIKKPGTVTENVEKVMEWKVYSDGMVF